MVKAITNVPQTQPVAQPKTVDKKAPAAKSRPLTADTVQISTAAKNAQAQSVIQAALQEATETPAQTAKEARSGDMQAKRLLAKEEAEAGKT